MILFSDLILKCVFGLDKIAILQTRRLNIEIRFTFRVQNYLVNFRLTILFLDFYYIFWVKWVVLLDWSKLYFTKPDTKALVPTTNHGKKTINIVAVSLLEKCTALSTFPHGSSAYRCEYLPCLRVSGSLLLFHE